MGKSHTWANIFHVRQQYRSRFKMQLFAKKYSHDQRFHNQINYVCVKNLEKTNLI